MTKGTYQVAKEIMDITLEIRGDIQSIKKSMKKPKKNRIYIYILGLATIIMFAFLMEFAFDIYEILERIANTIEHDRIICRYFT